jgi:hypothetical protein
MAAPWLYDCYRPFDFSTITGQPHDPPKSLERLPIFHGDNAISVNDHWDAFVDFIRSEMYNILFFFSNVFLYH